MLGDLAAEAPPDALSAAEPDDGPPVHSMLGDLAAMGAGDEASSEDEPDDGPPVHSMLGDLAAKSGPLPEAEPVSRSMLSLGASSAPPGAAGEGPIGPLTQHSTIAEIGGLEEHTSSPFPIERGVLISLVFHVLLLLVLIFGPTRIPAGSKGDLFAMMQPEPRDDTPIPVILDAPGPARPNPRKAPLSDADRRAGGGDKSKPKADTPYVPPTSGVAGLAPGPRAPRAAGRPVPPQQGAEAARQAAAEPARAGEKSDQKPSEFPAQARPQGDGPREIGKLANLNSAIQSAAQETARGSLAGGEGGSPAGNPDGGYLDSGPLSFDTKWYDWGAYAAEMIRRIKLHWDVPELARLGWKGSLTVRFYIMANGQVADAKIVRYSGIPPFDNAALQAILKSSPFRPLPDDLHEDREGITITFFYNMRPESEEKSQ